MLVQLTSDAVNSAFGHAASALDAVSAATAYAGNISTTLGAIEFKLNSIINDLASQEITMADSLSRIADTDFAAEMAQVAKLQIISQAGLAIAAQANSLALRATDILAPLPEDRTPQSLHAEPMPRTNEHKSPLLY